MRVLEDVSELRWKKKKVAVSEKEDDNGRDHEQQQGMWV